MFRDDIAIQYLLDEAWSMRVFGSIFVDTTDIAADHPELFEEGPVGVHVTEVWVAGIWR